MLINLFADDSIVIIWFALFGFELYLVLRKFWVKHFYLSFSWKLGRNWNFLQTSLFHNSMSKPSDTSSKKIKSQHKWLYEKPKLKTNPYPERVYDYGKVILLVKLKLTAIMLTAKFICRQGACFVSLAIRLLNVDTIFH